MQQNNKAALQAVIVTVVVIIGFVGLYWGGRAWWRSRAVVSNENLAPEVTPATDKVSGAEEDIDGDGLSATFESFYNTDPNNSDTDGDGALDLEELQLGRDPTKPAVSEGSDKLGPITGSLVPDLGTYTQKYLASLPADIDRANILSKEQLEIFIEQERGELLPQIPDSSLQINPATGKTEVSAYLDSISPGHNKALRPVTNDDVETALTAQLQLNIEPMKIVVEALEQNLGTLKALKIPAEVVDLHRTLLAATQALLSNVKLLRDIDNDFVGGLIASKNIDSLGAVFSDIALKVAALEKKYDLK